MGDYRVKVHISDARGDAMPLTVVVDAEDREDVHSWLGRAVRNKLILTWLPIADEGSHRCPQCKSGSLCPPTSGGARRCQKCGAFCEAPDAEVGHPELLDVQSACPKCGSRELARMVPTDGPHAGPGFQGCKSCQHSWRTKPDAADKPRDPRDPMPQFGYEREATDGED